MLDNYIAPEKPTLKTLSHTAAIISAESDASASTFKSLTRLLPKFVGDVKEFTTNIMNFGGGKPAPALNFHEASKRLTKVNYVDMSPITVVVPAGLCSTWEEYLDVLATNQAIALDLIPKVLTPSLRWISVLLSQPESLRSVRSSLLEYGLEFHDLDKAKRNFAACYDNHTLTTSRNFGEMYKRNSDYLEAIKRINDINVQMATIDKKIVVDMVDQINEALDKLLIRMAQQPEVYRVSGITTKDIATVANNMAREVEYFAAQVYALQAATQALLDTDIKLQTILKS